MRATVTRVAAPRRPAVRHSAWRSASPRTSSPVSPRSSSRRSSRVLRCCLARPGLWPGHGRSAGAAGSCPRARPSWQWTSHADRAGLARGRSRRAWPASSSRAWRSTSDWQEAPCGRVRVPDPPRLDRPGAGRDPRAARAVDAGAGSAGAAVALAGGLLIVWTGAVGTSGLTRPRCYVAASLVAYLGASRIAEAGGLPAAVALTVWRHVVNTVGFVVLALVMGPAGPVRVDAGTMALGAAERGGAARTVPVPIRRADARAAVGALGAGAGAGASSRWWPRASPRARPRRHARSPW